MADNWYVILELEFDPPVEDEKVIADKIDERAKFWSTHFNDFKMGAQYRTWHQNISKIKKDMIGPDQIRKQLAADACTIVYGPVDKLLKTVGRKGSITEDEATKIAQKLKTNEAMIKKRAAKLGIKVEKGGQTKDYKAIFEKYYKTKPQNAATFDGLQPMLKTFNVDNLYDFLYANTTVKNASRLPCNTLQQRAQEKKDTEFYKTDPTSGTGSKLCGQCQLTFKDEASKATYDQYLEYAKRKAILDDAKSIADISGELGQEQFDDYVSQLTQLFRDRNLAKDVLEAFCKEQRLSYNSNAQPQSNANIKVCRCGCINDVSDGRKVCSNCGLDLVIKCPKCGAANDASIRVCKCGFKFEDLDKAVALCEQAEQAMEALDFNVARAHLADAGRFWPGSRQVKELNDRLAEYEKRVGTEVAKMRDAIKAKKYFEARSQYQSVRKLFTGYSDAVMEQQINQAILKAQGLLAKAKAAKAEKDILELCAQAYDVCADLPGVKELMPAPAAVSGLMVRANTETRTNIITWNAVNDKSIRYVVVRSRNGWITHVADGETIFRGGVSSYSDQNIEPGVEYYYNVFAERAGLYSPGAQGNTKGVTNLFEIKNVSASAADGSLNIVWDPLPKNATAVIFETGRGTDSQVGTSKADGHLLSGLRNGIVYRYRVSLCYVVNGTKQYTKGVTVEGIPECPPQPIDTLMVKATEGDTFEVTWLQQGDDEVRLFCSTRKPKYSYGDIVAVSALEKEMRPLQHRPLPPQSARSLKPGEKGITFQHSSSDLLYITAAVVKFGSAVFGTVARARKGENVKVKDARPVNGKINLYIEAPASATGFVVLYRFDQFPSDISDTKTIRKYIPLKQYQLTSTLILDTMEQRKYYFAVFAEYKRDGESDYSCGSTYLFDNSPKANITYSIAVHKRLFGENSVILEFEADQNEFELPDIDVMSMVGNTPMFKNRCTLFHSIAGQHVSGILEVRIPMPKGIAKDTYIRPFFKDENAHDGSQLKLKLKSNYKIT